MSQILTPLDGGRAQVQTTLRYKPGVFVSSQYVQAKRLVPQPTEWGTVLGRPIYDRLPAASSRYKLDFGLDDDAAYVYNAINSNSLLVQSSGDSKFLTIQAGEIVWKQGQVPLNSVIIDLQVVGMRSTRYFLGYQLYYDNSPYPATYSVEDYSLAGHEMNVSSGTDSVPGWRYRPYFSFTNSQTQSWRNYDGIFPDYSGEAYLYWQTQYANSFSKIRLSCPPNTKINGTASLFFQACPSPVQGEKYCSNPEWLLQDTVSVQKDEKGQYFQFDIPYPSSQYGWKVSWSDPSISINNVTVSGIITLERKPATGITYCQLAAYPQNAVPSTIVNSEGVKVPVVMCGLALVDTNNLFEVEKITDIRKTVNTEYQPIADWLTKPWDENLKDLYNQTNNYPSMWMAPQTALLNEYANLEDYSVKVEI